MRAAIKNALYIPLEQYCVVCGNKFTVKRNMHGKQKYCSRDCKIVGVRNLPKVKAYTKKYLKVYRENNVEKLNEIALENHDKSYFSGNRKNVFERDKHKCVKCGSTHYLGVHHKDESGKSDNPNNDIDNLITLCAACHAREHKKLTYGINYDMFTKEFLLEAKERLGTWKEVEKHYGVSNSFIIQRKREVGIPIRKKG
jgi:5-methylcytosine-specific restriction endonuclease McrA